MKLTWQTHSASSQIVALVLALTFFVVGIPFFGGTSAIAQDASKKPEQTKKAPAKKKRVPNPAFQPPVVQEGLPNVLLIGDSISIGYMIPARKQLQGIANVWRPPTNCGPSTTGVNAIDKWLGDRKWDVIHFNFGLHDLKYMGPNNENLADPAAKTSHQQVPPDDYAANLTKIAKRLKETGATVIWRETTPTPEGCKGRVPGDSKKYNEVAAKVMKEIGGIETDAMFEFALKHAEQRKANVHYSAAGSAKLAEQVARSVKAALESRSK